MTLSTRLYMAFMLIVLSGTFALDDAIKTNTKHAYLTGGL